VLVGPRAPDEHGSPAWARRYRQVWRRNLPLFLFTALVFLASSALGWRIGVSAPEYAPVILSQRLVEDILEKNRWFDSIRESPWASGLAIAANNIKVAVNAFALGAVLGIGGLLVLIFNGLVFGGVLGFCQANGFDRELSAFVSGHGPLELTIIVASTFASFLLGRVFYMRPYSLFRHRMRKAAAEAGCVLLGVLPWLILAAALEVFVSPWPQFSDRSKGLIGLIAAAAFWAWTLAPSRGGGRASADQARSDSRSSP
jgi:uncharacterized membrane protein SpoIIM required for sporulation